jgi:hypothetical protein
MKSSWLRLGMALSVLSFLSLGCFQTETWTTIDNNMGMERKIDIQIAKESKDQLKSKKEILEKDGWKVSEEEKDAKYHLMASKKVDNANNFKSPFDDTMIKVEKKDKKLTFSEEFDAKKSAGIGETDTTRTMWKELKYTFHVTMPSKIENTNADKKEGNTATWEFDVDKVFDIGKFTMTAESAEGGMCGSTIFVVGLGLGAFLFALKMLIDWALAYRRRLRTSAC